MQKRRILTLEVNFMSSFATQTYYLYRRAFRQSIRPYFALMPEFVMPVFFFIVNSAAFQRAADIPGFGANSYLAFYAPVSLLMAIFFSSGSTGLEVVTDIATGYMDRLFVAPIKRSAVILGKLLATGTRATIQAAIMLTFLTLMGAPLQGGFIGVLLILALAFLFGMAWAGVGLSLALITKNPRVVQSSFVFFFPFTMITTSQLPLNLLEGWYKVAVQINPVTYILEGMRTIMTVGLETTVISTAFLSAVGFAAATLGLATWFYRKLSA